MNDLRKHGAHYIPLILVVVGGIAGFLLFSHDRTLQFALAIALSISYVAWGVVHHKIHDELDFFVFLEYFAVALLGLVMVLFLIYRA